MEADKVHSVSPSGLDPGEQWCSSRAKANSLGLQAQEKLMFPFDSEGGRNHISHFRGSQAGEFSLT